MTFDWWTLGLQTINVLVLLWVLQRFFFKPVQSIIVQRQQALKQLTDDANKAKQRAEQEQRALDLERNAANSARDELLNKARAEAREASAAMQAQASKEIELRNAAAQATLVQERAEAELVLQEHVSNLAIDVARRLLLRLPATAMNDYFMQAAYDEISGMTEQDRKSLIVTSPASDKNTVELIAAIELDHESQELIQNTLNHLLDNSVMVAFKCDASLLAGVELHFHHVVISSNLAADLRQILEHLHHDDDPARVA